MYTCIIIDDDSNAIEGLKSFLKHLPKIEVIATFTNPVEALEMLVSTDHVDLVLSDIDMQKISGIELSKLIRNKADKFVFTTAHSHYGYNAFEVHASGYLLKPYSLHVFLDLMYRLFPSISESKHVEINNDFFFVKSKEDNLKLIRIAFGDIYAVESKLNYIRIHTSQKSIYTYMSLSEMSKKLMTRDCFVKFQRSFILNTNHIKQIDGHTVEMNNDLKISVGEYYKKDFNEFLSKYLIKAKIKK